VEVVKTSEELEKQILEDARKKAAKILETADKECAQIRAQWAGKLEEESRKVEEDCARKIGAVRAELDAALPLDFMRTRLAFTEEALRSQLDGFFSSLSAAEVSRIISTLIKRVSQVFEGKHIKAFVGGLEAKTAEKMLREQIPGVTVAEVRPISEAGGRKAAKDSQGIIIETEDEKIRYRGTFGELRQILMEDYREELVSALLGKKE
jgi:V/A-type H+-transporting ATPase subunit E